MSKNNLVVELETSVNGVKFNADASAVKAVFGKPSRSMKKAFFSKSRTDVYDDFHIFYSDKGQFEAIEVFGEVSVYVNRETVYPGTLAKAKKAIPGLSGEHEDFTSNKASVGITTDEDGKNISSILFGCAGYYTK